KESKQIWIQGRLIAGTTVPHPRIPGGDPAQPTAIESFLATKDEAKNAIVRTRHGLAVRGQGKRGRGALADTGSQDLVILRDPKSFPFWVAEVLSGLFGKRARLGRIHTRSLQERFALRGCLGHAFR